MTGKIKPAPKVPKKFSGQWIAWNHALTKIVGSGLTFDAALEAAEKAGESKPYLTKAPKGPARFAGGTR